MVTQQTTLKSETASMPIPYWYTCGWTCNVNGWILVCWRRDSLPPQRAEILSHSCRELPETLLRLQVPAIGWSGLNAIPGRCLLTTSLRMCVCFSVHKISLLHPVYARHTEADNRATVKATHSYDQNVKLHWSESRSNGINCDRLQISPKVRCLSN